MEKGVLKSFLKKYSLSFFVFIIVGITMFALLKNPSEIIRARAQSDDIVASLDVNDINTVNNCEMLSNGRINVIADDANIVFNEFDYEFQTVALKFQNKLTDNIKAEIYYDRGNGFNEAEKSSAVAFVGEDNLVFELPDSKFNCIRIDVDENYDFFAVELHSKPALQDTVYPKNSVWIYIISVVIAGIFAAISFVIDKKYKISQAVFAFFITRKKIIMYGAAGFLGCLAVAFAVEFLLGKFVFGIATNGEFFNLRRAVWIFGILFTCLFLYLCRKIASDKSENILFGIVLILGSVMIIASPFGHISWDIGSHHNWSYEASHIGENYQTNTDLIINTYEEHFHVVDTARKNEENIDFANRADKKIYTQNDYGFSLPHISSGILIAVGKLFGMNFYAANTLGKFGNLLIYALCCYFAARKLKSGKMILSVIALFPTNLFLATTYSYDFWVNGFVMLGMAYFVGERQNIKECITVKNTVIMCAAFVLAFLPKQTYIPLLLIPFFMPREKLKSKKIYYSICIIAIITLFVFLVMRSLTEVSNGGDVRGGSDVNPTEQIKFILYNPIKYIVILFEFLPGYLSVGNAHNYISSFAYLGIGTGAVVFIALMLITAVTDKNEYDIKTSGWFLRSASVCIFMACVVLSATAMYTAFTGVGSETIAGCQPRYIIPLLYPLMSVIGYNKFKNKMNRTIYNYSILIPCSVVVYYNIYELMITRWC